ncbi:MAG: NAD(P)/FAD-dependent oxidoreductase, partial [Pseudomonadota bacterium]
MNDLAIIGGGPAGTSAAITARRRGLSVAIWERDRFPRDKVCGEFISAESLPLLREQIPEALARGAEVQGAEFVPRSGRAYAFNFSSPACGLSRWVMDEALWQAARASGAQTLEGTAVRGVCRANGPSSAW